MRRFHVLGRERSQHIVISGVLSFLVLLVAACGEADPTVGEATTVTTRNEEVVQSRTPEPEPSPAEAAAPQPTPTAVEPVEEEPPAIPEVLLPSGNREVYVMNADGTEQRRLTVDPAQHFSPVWSPDGRRVAFVRGSVEVESSGLFVMDVDGSNLRQLTPDAGPAGIAWSPDGSAIAFTTVHGHNGGYPEIYLIEADGTNQRRLTSPALIPTERQYMGVRAPSWSPDGDQIVFVVDELDSQPALFIMAADGESSATRLAGPEWAAISDVAWSPAGNLIAFVVDDVESGMPAIHVIDSDGRNERRIGIDGGASLSPSWSPDGTRIVFAGTHGNGLDVYVVEISTGDVRRLTDDPSNNESPSWSPDGRHIAFVSERDGRLAEPCSFQTYGLLGPPPSLEEAAWTSHLIVLGTVVDETEPAWDVPHAGGTNPCLQIVTDYFIEVERQYRGEPVETVRVRVEGGMIGIYRQSIEPTPNLVVGDRVLLLLYEAPPSDLLPPAYSAAVQRSFVVVDGRLEATGVPSEHDGLEVGEVERRIRVALDGEPPPNAIPLEEAPLTDE
jgi:Tol biopolymer transport system component